MRVLYHQCLSPFCRKVRIVLGEKKLEHELRAEAVWEQRPEFLSLNPAGDVPVLVESDGTVLADSQAIAEYLDEVSPDPPLLGETPLERAEARRLIAWFDHKFDAEVTRNLVGEKVMSRLLRRGHPDSSAIRAGHANVRCHLEYICFLMERRNWLGGDRFSLADITAAAHFSCIDYIGDVPWDRYEDAKTWYARVKSRPSFRSILGDTIPGLPPVAAYADLDF
ncbi:MAG: glutathione S-transferase family protein [Rhodospirillales bacterium]|nr:glutathione S-transferase family protein [Rhodospirillales bacterium]